MKDALLGWKPNWAETRGHFEAWWRYEGLVLTTGWQAATPPHEVVAEPPPAPSVEASYAEAGLRAGRNHYTLPRHRYQGDTLPTGLPVVEGHRGHLPGLRRTRARQVPGRLSGSR